MWLSVNLPWLPLEVFVRGGRDGAPLAISSIAGRVPRVVACNGAARRLGVRTGMAVGAAQALAADLRVQPRDSIRERRALERLAAWAGQFTPVVSLEAPATLLLEVEGSLNLFGGAGELQRQVLDGLAALGYQAQLALAPTPLAAAWLAQAGEGVCVQGQGALVKALVRLPVDILELEPAQLARLRGMGLEDLGDCLRLPRDGLARRLAPVLVETLDRALGRRPDPRSNFVPPARFDSRLILPAEVFEVDALLFAVRRLFLELSGLLQARLGGVQSLRLRLFHQAEQVTDVSLELTAPSRDPQHLLDLLRARLERITLPLPVREIELSAPTLTTLPGKTRDWIGTAAGEGCNLNVLIEQLRARLGQEAVHGVCQIAEHRPEYAWQVCNPGTVGAAPQFARRPLWLLPQPVVLQVRAGRPWLDGALTLEPQCERIESGWWDGGDMARDYYVASDSRGARFWIYRELRGMRAWFLQGVFG